MRKFEILTDIIRSRRAVFPHQFQEGLEIDDDLIMNILENANCAPTHKRTEPWRFKVIKGESRKRLSAFAGDWYKKNTPDEKYSELKYQKQISNPLKSSHIIAICMKRNESSGIPEWEEVAAVACAVQNMWLSCSALGIGSYWSTPGSIYDASEFLGLDSDERCLGWFYMGWIAPNLDLKLSRTAIEAKVELI